MTDHQGRGGAQLGHNSSGVSNKHADSARLMPCVSRLLEPHAPWLPFNKPKGGRRGWKRKAAPALGASQAVPGQ